MRVRPARSWQAKDAPLRLIANRAIPKLRRSLRTTLGVAKRLLDTEHAAHLIASGRYAEVPDLINWQHAEEALRHPMQIIGGVWIDGAMLGQRKLNGAFTSRRRQVRYGKGLIDVAKDHADLFAFDRFNPQTQAKIRALQDALIADLGEDSRDVIESAILSGLRRAEDPEQIAADIRAVIGLAPAQAQAVTNFRRQLQAMDRGALDRALLHVADREFVQTAIDAGRAFTAGQIDTLTQSYEAAYIDYRAQTIARTEATTAASLGLEDSYLQAVERGVLPSEAVRKHWQVALDERTCEHCLSVVDMNPDGVPLGEAFDSDEGPVDAPGLHPNCFPAGVLVEARGVQAATKRWYDGDLVVINTAGGKQFSCTPNHPILTPSGWIAAHHLDVGCHVISRRLSERVAGADADGEDVPTHIEDIAEAFGRAQQVAAVPVPVAAEDFHGDGGGSKVAIVWANRGLMHRGDATGGEHGSEVALGLRHMQLQRHHGLSVLDLFRHGLLAAKHTGMRLLGLLRPLVRAHAAPLQGLGFAGAAHGHAGFGQPQTHDATAYAEASSERLLRVPGGVERGSFLDWDEQSARANEASFSHIARHPRLTMADDWRDLMRREAGLIEADRVVNVSLRRFSGHVFNLETEAGYYIANGVYTHNCRCSLELVTDIGMIPDDADVAF